MLPIPQPALQAPTLKFSRKLSIMSETLVNLSRALKWTRLSFFSSHYLQVRWILKWSAKFARSTYLVLLPFHPSSHFCVAMMSLHLDNNYRLEQSNVTLKSFEIAQLINLTPSNDMVSLPKYFMTAIHLIVFYWWCTCLPISSRYGLKIATGRSGVCERNDSLPCTIYRAPTTRLFGCASTASISVLHVELI